MISFKLDYSKNLKEHLPEVLSLAERVMGEPMDRQLKFYFRNQSRCLLIFDEEMLIGVYLYSPAIQFFANPKWLSLRNHLRESNIALEDCCVPTFLFVDMYWRSDRLHDAINEVRVKDAKQMGYKYGIVGADAYAANSPTPKCVEREWVDQTERFSNNTGCPIVPLGFKNGHGEEVYIQHYVPDTTSPKLPPNEN